MPVTQTSLVTSSDGVDATSFVTASITPSAAKLILAAIVNDAATEAATVEPTLSGNGLTWVSIATIKVVTTHRLTLFRAMGSPSAGAVTIDFAGNTQSACAWSIQEFGNVNTGGLNGANAVVQSTTNTAAVTTTVVATLAAFGSLDNATFGAFGTTTGAAIAPGSGFTEIGDSAAGGSHVETEWRIDNDTSVDATTGVNTNWTVIAVEIGFEVAVATSTLWRFQ